MIVECVELRRIAMPLVRPFRTPAGDHDVRDILLVRVRTPEAEGWGECVALEDPTYTEEYVDGAHAVIREHLLPRLPADVRAENVAAALAAVRGHPMAKAAIETAVLDAELQLRGEPLSAYLGATRDHVDAGVAVGLAGSVAELLDEVDGYLAQGYRRVKLKIQPGWDVDPVAAVRHRHPDLALQVDANRSYPRILDVPDLDPFELLLIEEPLPTLLADATLARAIRTPVCLDESITSTRDVELALHLGACDVVNIKPGRVGGLLEAKRIHDLCAAHGVPVWCGGMLETGIGRSANVALAALPGFSLPGDLSASDRYYRRDLTAPFTLEDGRLEVSRRPGITPAVFPDVLADVTVSVDEYRGGTWTSTSRRS